MTDKLQNKDAIKRPPVVVVMGHVDHGKSKLLDYIRKSNIVDKEAGGITQHIGAYEVGVHPTSGDGEKEELITFLDTPGHEAFSKMRSRGAKVADIAILVVAADEGVKPQTIEAIKIIQEEKIPFIVALNKIDKPNAEPDKIKNELASNNVFVEGFGGNVSVVNISAKTGEGIPDLLDTILLTAEMEDLKADKSADASGIVIEANLDQQRGITATLLILDGTIKKGMFVVSGEALAPVRIFEDFKGRQAEEKSFSSPIKITGFDSLPKVGSKFQTYQSKKEAIRSVSETKDINPIQGERRPDKVGKIIVSIVIKADVTGSLEAIAGEINKLSEENVFINILRQGVGTVNKDDAKIASSAKDAYIIGFNVKTESGVSDFADKFNIKIKNFDIIYAITDWLKEEILKKKSEFEQQNISGEVKILKIFEIKGNKYTIGGEVIKGEIRAEMAVNIKRRGAVIAKGEILSVQRGTLKVESVPIGEQFGAVLESKVEIVKDDHLEVFTKLD